MKHDYFEYQVFGNRTDSSDCIVMEPFDTDFIDISAWALRQILSFTGKHVLTRISDIGDAMSQKRSLFRETWKILLFQRTMNQPGHYDSSRARFQELDSVYHCPHKGNDCHGNAGRCHSLTPTKLDDLCCRRWQFQEIRCDGQFQHREENVNQSTGEHDGNLRINFMMNRAPTSSQA